MAKLFNNACQVANDKGIAIAISSSSNASGPRRSGRRGSFMPIRAASPNASVLRRIGCNVRNQAAVAPAATA